MKVTARTRREDERGREALLHLSCGRHTALTLARALGVSRITAFRILQGLRRRGNRIVSVKRGGDWYFEVEERESGWENDPLVRRLGFIRSRRPPIESVDDALYGRDS